jgi:hypothetical protein
MQKNIYLCDMEKEFVPYELALRMKQLGFDETCFGCYTKDKELSYDYSDNREEGHYFQDCTAPTYSQAFRWFREKYTTKGWVTPIVNVDGFSDIHEARIHQEESSVLVLGNYDSYEEAELACLEKLIKIVEQKEK